MHSVQIRERFFCVRLAAHVSNGQFVQDGGICDKIKRYEQGRRAEDCGRERMPWVIDSVWVLPAPEKAVSFISG